ncbi:hypothetical protein Stsp02_69130 [Streptomyces sp. NBRC 14336]|uniref:hypothetical protein n=1 Tax=Streptomyces sp. NBRC 14336 TaxID=3030992 RepID=UPI0024A0E308|nr:hypothetical protein [Streptomyces sp. NBRC 14336]WBO78924.1 hypothetical protein SBE_002570 [Streptomyces sp. SBE_14.2]GLW51252.1 hypothetical protein Stsp02_69130 [Streptomyces sp. NBRC 14336]
MNQDSAPTAVTVWHRHLASGWMLATGLVSALGLVVIAAVDRPHRAMALWLLIVSAAFLVTGAIRVTVSPGGVTAGSALLPFLRRRFPLDRIEAASAGWTRPTEIGGWGYRWNPGLSAISLREGDALWLTLTNGNKFVITIDDAETAAQLTNQLLAHGRKGR